MAVTEVLYSVEGREPLELLNRLYQHNVSAPNTSLTEREMKRVHYSMPSFATCTNKQGRGFSIWKPTLTRPLWLHN